MFSLFFFWSFLFVTGLGVYVLTATRRSLLQLHLTRHPMLDTFES